MKIRPIILDARPSFLAVGGRADSLLLAPVGTSTVLEYLCAWLEQVTRESALVISVPPADTEWVDATHTLPPDVAVVTSSDALTDAVAGFELSDALLIVDPRALPLRSSDLSELCELYAVEPRIAHHLVVFESAVAGTKEQVSLDKSGHVRRILRHYEPATWPFISGVAASILPVACGVLVDGVVPSSLMQLRHVLAGRGVPGRDMPAHAGAMDLTAEQGFLAATEHLVRKAVGLPENRSGSARPLYVGQHHVVHPTARLSGPVVLHAGVEIDEGAVIVGPAVIGAGAHIGARAVVAHATVGPACEVPEGTVVRDRVWCDRVRSAPRSRGPSLMAGPSPAFPRAAGAAAVVSETPAIAVRGAGVTIKRSFDAVVAAIALLLLSPLMLLVAAIVRMESRGSVFYGDEREGLGGRVFRCWKFRTMHAGAHAVQRNLKALDKMDGPHFKLERDPRVTRAGRILRALNFDELPQLFNVLCGEMSLVGPRPSPFRENQVCVPWREARLSVRPGITGFWQVCRHDRSSGDFHQWIEYDLLYVQHASLWLDLKIVLATMATLGGKVSHVPASWLVPAAGLVPVYNTREAPAIESSGVPARSQSRFESERAAS